MPCNNAYSPPACIFRGRHRQLPAATEHGSDLSAPRHGGACSLRAARGRRGEPAAAAPSACSPAFELHAPPGPARTEPMGRQAPTPRHPHRRRRYRRPSSGARLPLARTPHTWLKPFFRAWVQALVGQQVCIGPIKDGDGPGPSRDSFLSRTLRNLVRRHSVGSSLKPLAINVGGLVMKVHAHCSGSTLTQGSSVAIPSAAA